MKKVTKVSVTIFEVEGNEESETTLTSPTIDMAIEKMGAFERMREHEKPDVLDDAEDAVDNDRDDALFEGVKEQSELEGEDGVEK